MTARVTIVDNGEVVLDEEIDAYDIDTWCPDNPKHKGAFRVVASMGDVP